jgi:MoxR-like ATPase
MAEMYVDAKVTQYADRLLAATRKHARIRTGAGVGHVAALIEAAKANARAQQRSYVTPHDIKVAAPSFLRGKIHLVDDAADTVDVVIANILDNVEVP